MSQSACYSDNLSHLSNFGNFGNFDIVIVGCGVAGLSLATHLPPTMSIAIVASEDSTTTASNWAQGGIAATIDDQDCLESHVQDTVRVGCGLVDIDATTTLLESSRSIIDWLVSIGAEFDRKSNGSLHLHREGGHSHRRIVHNKDKTGNELMRVLWELVHSQRNVQFIEGWAYELLLTEHKACGGVAIFDGNNNCGYLQAQHTVLATGGASGIFLYSTTPPQAVGHGMAMAMRAGCRLINLEMQQYHPTCLYSSKEQHFLLTEAIRGEGGLLKRPDGSRFMPDYHPDAELAPRDIVARAIDTEMKLHGFNHVMLDITHKPASFITEHFPTIYTHLQQAGFDMTREYIPVVPAAHYSCGGVASLPNGTTEIAGLSVLGETAHTGLHGANRLASNSLLECLSMGKLCAQNLADNLPPSKASNGEHLDLAAIARRANLASTSDHRYNAEITHIWRSCRHLCWHLVGIVRNNNRLQLAQKQLQQNWLRLTEISEHSHSRQWQETYNLVQVARAMVGCALQRTENRGLHFNEDCSNFLDDSIADDSLTSNLAGNLTGNLPSNTEITLSDLC